ncbi:MAG: DUF5683 domain-containing protein [Bacteroidales bacterium]|nr:DUF5683 domain-containing protein [Bacteroidales bacterium]
MKRFVSVFALYLCFVSLFAQQEKGQTGTVQPTDSLKLAGVVLKEPKPEAPKIKKKEFVPNPQKAILLSAFFPGLGQIYNQKYWKLPLIYGGYAGLAYGLAWNNQYLGDYTSAYNDIKDSDPNTNSFLTILPLSMQQSYQKGTLTTEQLSTILKNQKDYFRRNRDLTIISMVGLYFVTMIDAYVDAQLFEFDISPDLSLKIEPTMIRMNQIDYRTQGLGLQCSINF